MFVFAESSQSQPRAGKTDHLVHTVNLFFFCKMGVSIEFGQNWKKKDMLLSKLSTSMYVQMRSHEIFALFSWQCFKNNKTTAVFIAMVKLLEMSLQAPHPQKNTVIFLVKMIIRVSRS